MNNRTAFLPLLLVFAAPMVFADDIPPVPAWVVEQPVNHSQLTADGGRIELFDATWSDLLQVMSPYLKRPIAVDSSSVEGKKISFVASFNSPELLERILTDFASAHGLAIVDAGPVRVLLSQEEANKDTGHSSLTLTNVSAADLVEVLRSASPDVSVAAHGLTLVFSGPRRLLPPVVQLAKNLDVPKRILDVEAVVFEASSSDLKRIGVDISAAAGNLSVISKTSLPGFLTGGFRSSDFSAVVEAMESSQSVRVLSRPRLVLVDGEKGSLLVGQDVPIISGGVRQDDGSIYQTIERRDVGTLLSIHPIVIGSRVRLSIKQEVSRVASNVDASDVVFDTRNLDAVTEAVPGEMLLLGGLVLSRSDGVVRGVPGLSRLPWLGKLFTYTGDENSESTLNLLVRVTLRG